MAKHRREDRDKGITGQADPQKAKAEYERIMRQAREADQQSRQQRGSKAQGVVWAGGITLLAAIAETVGRWPA